MKPINDSNLNDHAPLRLRKNREIFGKNQGSRRHEVLTLVAEMRSAQTEADAGRDHSESRNGEGRMLLRARLMRTAQDEHFARAGLFSLGLSLLGLVVQGPPEVPWCLSEKAEEVSLEATEAPESTSMCYFKESQIGGTDQLQRIVESIADQKRVEGKSRRATQQRIEIIFFRAAVGSRKTETEIGT